MVLEPGSDSPVSCQPNDSHCPAGNECVESSILGFHLCCSALSKNVSAFKRPSRNNCPRNIRTNRQSCEVNAIGVCPFGYTCLARRTSSSNTRGSCCFAQPKCLIGQPKVVSGDQV
ncbi:unnamed protein product [Anisakis simplex]|uniref:EB domain-containing protein n=1 Tax=Anisakis simplex TaxID=6269 RepID=A0A0M3JCG8_ANISI|nr:unnamed protein product [Anisakis simplex]